jgi:hypothetical protein
MNRAIALHRLRPVIDRTFAFAEAQGGLPPFRGPWSFRKRRNHARLMHGAHSLPNIRADRFWSSSELSSLTLPVRAWAIGSRKKWRWFQERDRETGRHAIPGAARKHAPDSSDPRHLGQMPRWILERGQTVRDDPAAPTDHRRLRFVGAIDQGRLKSDHGQPARDATTMLILL